MKKWKKTQLGDIITLQRGFDITKKEQVEGEYPVISSSGIQSYHNQYKVEGAGVITGRKGSLGKVFFVKENFWPHDTTLWVKDFKGNNKKFIYYLLKTINLESYDVGSANPTLNRNHIHGLWLRIPPLPTQRRIASILSAYDDLIENNLRRIRLLEEAAQLIYKEWFVHLRFPGHENVKVVDGVPEGWERVKLNKVWNIKYGKNLPTKNIKNQGDFPVYGAAGKIGYYGKYNQEAKVALVTSRGNGSGQVHRTRGKAFVTNNSFVFLPQFKQVTFFYSVECLKIIDLTRYRTGSAQPQLTIAGMSNISLLLPSLKTLERYNNLVRPLIDQVDQLFEINELLTEARDLLLPRLMSGTIKLEEAEEKNTFPQ